MESWIEALAPSEFRTQAKDAFGSLDVGALTQESFLDVVSACGRRCIAKCPNELPAVEVEGFVVEMAQEIWTSKKFNGRCPLRELLSRLRVSSEFGPRECAFMTKYFYYFGKMRSHDGMMNDIGRTETYRKAIFSNPDDFKGKVVMDVGSGSGLLAFFAIQAGAKKVYAVEAGCMHEVIRQLAKANGWEDKIVVVNKVLQDMTEADCPLNSVDTLIAETLGTFLFGERGIETMLVARDRFLKPNGGIFPTRCTLSLQPFSDKKLHADQAAMSLFWTETNFYGIDLSSCHERAMQEKWSQVVSSMVDPDSLVASQHDVVYDFRSLDSADLRNIHLAYDFGFQTDADMHGLAGWFIAEFVGQNETIRLSTAPQDTCTHWWQVRFLIPKPLEVKKGQTVSGTMDMRANEQQTYTCSMDMKLETANGVERRTNADMGLMDLDSALKTHSYKTITHGNVSVAVVDWEKTTTEARKAKFLENPISKTLNCKFVGQRAKFDGVDYICANNSQRYRELLGKQLAIVGKMGGNSSILAQVGNERFGVIRREETGEDSLWMEISDYQKFMIDYAVSHKPSLSGFQTKSDEEVRSHFRNLSFEQVTEVYSALTSGY